MKSTGKIFSKAFERFKRTGVRETTRHAYLYVAQRLYNRFGSFLERILRSDSIIFRTLGKLVYSPFIITQRILDFRSVCKQTFAEFFIRYHPALFRFVCINSHLFRKLRKPRLIESQNEVKVLHITCSFDLGGTQRQIVNLCSNNDSSSIKHDVIEIFPEVNYLYRTDVTLERSRYVRGNRYSRKIGTWVMDTSLRSMQMLQLYKLICDFTETRPDIVVGWGHEVAMLTFVAASMSRVPKIVFCIRTFNPAYGWTTIGPLLKESHARMIPLLDGVVVNSTVLQEDYSAWLNIARERICVVSNGIDIELPGEEGLLKSRKEIRKLYGIAEDATVILNIGRFSKEKGQMLLIGAYKELIDSLPEADIYCILGGDGPTQVEAAAYKEMHKLSKLLLVGRMNNVPDYLSASDIFVMPSDFEGMPNAMMEAMAFGLPCISTNRTGAMDIARDNQEALYVNVGSEEELTEKLSYLLKRPEEQKRLGKNAKERLREFSIPRMVSSFNNNLERLISSNGCCSPK